MPVKYSAERFTAEVDALLPRLRVSAANKSGTLARVVGMTLEARGINAPLGTLCEVDRPGTEDAVQAEVVGFADDTIYLMPYTDPTGIRPGARVRVVSQASHARVGPELLGRVIDAQGRPLDGGPTPQCATLLGLQGMVINPMERGPVSQVLDVGIKTINALLTMGRGQRVGLIAGSGVGKSVLLGMMTRYAQADIVVIGLIGERGREVREFITNTLGAEGLARSVVIAAPANVSPVLRIKATHLAHLVAEYFRDQGRNVLLLLDSLTRVAHAQREIGLAVGEPPTTKGYPPSVFGLLPGLIERSGMGRVGQGSITAIYTVLAEGDDTNDPIVDLARASLDGQVMLSRALADAAHFPAIDLAGSVSRVMPSLVSTDHARIAARFRRYWTLYQNNRDLIQVGAYKAGSNPDLDAAIRLRLSMEHFLLQEMSERATFDNATDLLREIMKE